MHIRSIVLAAVALAPVAAHTADGSPASAYVAAGGFTANGTSSLNVGMAWPAFWQRGGWSAHAEGFVGVWHAPQAAGGHKNFWQVGLLPVVRYRFGNAAAPVFVEGSIGLTLMHDVYTGRRKTFSTRFQFQDTLGVGMNLGARGEHEVGLRLTHFSNAGIERPNPGENFVQVRYGRSF